MFQIGSSTCTNSPLIDLYPLCPPETDRYVTGGFGQAYYEYNNLFPPSLYLFRKNSVSTHLSYMDHAAPQKNKNLFFARKVRYFLFCGAAD